MSEKMQRRSFLRTTSAGALGLGAAYPAGLDILTPATGPGKLPYRIIYNDDTVNIFNNQEKATLEHLDSWIDQVVDGGADLYLQCCCYHRVFHPSRVWETWWEEYRVRGTIFGKKVEGGWINADPFMQLADMGIDFLEYVMKRCRARGIASGVSLRMDDFHYRGPGLGKNTVNERLSRFYQDPGMYLENTGRTGERWAFNYERPEVREHYLALIREVTHDYDIDVLDLDFMRHPPFFDRQDMDRHCETMTGFFREIKRICKDSGRNISVLTRIPSTPANCLELGLDVAAWAREGLVNGIALALKGRSGWEAPADEFKSLTGSGVSVYTCTERAETRIDPGEFDPEGETGNSAGERKESGSRWNRESLKGFSAGQLANGADGIYLFNFFLGNLPHINVLSEMKSLEQLRGEKKRYRMTTTLKNMETDLPMQVPVHVPARQARRFEMLLAAEKKGTPIEAHVILDRKVKPEEVWLQLNQTPLGHASRVEENPGDHKFHAWAGVQDEISMAVFHIPVKAMEDGRNLFVFRNEGESLSVLEIVVCTG